MLDLRFENIQDPLVRDAIFNIVEEFRRQDSFNCNFKHFEITITGTIVGFKYPHKMGIVPKDIIVLSQIGVGVAEFNYENFDNVNFDITSTDTVTVRFLAGNFDKNSQA